MAVRVVDVNAETLRYVSLCTHVDEVNPEREKAAEIRLDWLKDTARKEGMITKVAIDGEGKPLGFIHAVQVESPLSCMIGRSLLVIRCLTISYKLVYNRVHGTGVGRLLVQSCEDEARRAGFKGLAVYAYSDDFWFMPSAFFEKLGFKRAPQSSDIWVKKWKAVEDPVQYKEKYKYVPVQGKVVIDCFWSPFCLTLCGEAHNIRDVASEFGEKVVLNEYRCDDPRIAKEFGLFRALFINGERKNWGYEAPKEELRKEIDKALKADRR